MHDEGVHVERNNLDIGEVKENENISENQRNEIANCKFNNTIMNEGTRTTVGEPLDDP